MGTLPSSSKTSRTPCFPRWSEPEVHLQDPAAGVVVWNRGAGADAGGEEGGDQLYGGGAQANNHQAVARLWLATPQRPNQEGRSHCQLRRTLPRPALPELQGHHL